MAKVFLSIGTNLGNRKENIRSALRKIQSHWEIIKCSKPYRTKPYGNLDQPDYINMVVLLQTEEPPLTVLETILSIELDMGRVREKKWDNRIIDIDILYYDHEIIYNERLIVPHNDMHNRYFMLKPLSDIAPNFEHPVLKMTTTEMLSGLPKP